MTPEQLLPNQKQTTMKSAEEILKEIANKNGHPNWREFTRSTEPPRIDKYVIEAMHEYAAQHRWVKVDKDNLPNCEVWAVNDYGCYAIGILEIGTHGDVICYNKQLTMYDVTHYQIPTAPKD